MNIIVTGATGFIGKPLIAALRSRGDTVTAFVRNPERARQALGNGVTCVTWEAAVSRGPWEESIAGADAVVNLAGEPVMGKRWNEDYKARILSSRVEATAHIVEAIARAPHKPRVLVNGSGMDYYGETDAQPADESFPAGRGFLSSVTVAWEAEAARVASAGVREVRLRIGMVLGAGGGALETMALPFKLFAGGVVGSGQQWVSWIHLGDMVRAIVRTLDDDSLRGPVNAVSPAPVRMKEFARALGRALHRPVWAPVPTFALRAALGESADVALESKRVVPSALERAGFTFEHADLDEALRSALAV